MGVSKDASPAEIRNAFRNLVRQAHPDKVPEEQKTTAVEKMIRLQKAYSILADRETRKRYDAQVRLANLKKLVAVREAEKFEYHAELARQLRVTILSTSRRPARNSLEEGLSENHAEAEDKAEQHDAEISEFRPSPLKRHAPISLKRFEPSQLIQSHNGQENKNTSMRDPRTEAVTPKCIPRCDRAIKAKDSQSRTMRPIQQDFEA